MNRYPIVQNQPSDNQVRSYDQYYLTPRANPQYFPLPPLPQPSLSDFIHVASGVGSLIALGVTIFGNDEQRETAAKWLALTIPVFEFTKPTPKIPQMPLPTPALPTANRISVIPKTPAATVPELVVRPINQLQQQVQQLQYNEAELRHIIGEACRQLAVTQGELTLVREVILGDYDESDG